MTTVVRRWIVTRGGLPRGHVETVHPRVHAGATAHTGATAQDITSRLADVDAAIARSDWPVTVTLARDLGPQIDDLARPAYGSNIPSAAKAAAASQTLTHQAWTANGALDEAIKASDSLRAHQAALQVSQALHQALSQAEDALSLLKSGGGSGISTPALIVGIGAAALGVGLGITWLRARSGSSVAPMRSTWLPPEPG